MCGIAGIVDWSGAPGRRETVDAMTRRLERRGPDGSGIHSEPGVAFGHRRLSIIDLSDRAAQPMSNEDGTVWLTFNGEIYNHAAIRADLESRGHRFRSDSDSEVLVHLYEQHAERPERMLDSVRGMFAFAIWDRARRRVLLARDRIGIKPLVYFENGDVLAFASDIDALSECPDVPRRLDWTSLYEYLLLLTVPGPQTILRDVRHLEPGSMLIATAGRSRVIRYWRLETLVDDEVSSEEEADALVEERIGEAVRLHLVSDVEVGAFLSGGIDSGLVSAMSAEASGSTLRTFSATFPGASVDEGPWARDFAATIGASHTEFPLLSGFLDGVDRVVNAMDQPMALTSGVSLFRLAQLARNHIKVVLTGDGGDEAFGGYARHRRYSPPASAAWIPESVRPIVGRVGAAVIPNWARRRSGAIEKARALTSAIARDAAELYVPRLYVLLPDQALSLLPTDVAASVDTERYVDRVRGFFHESRGAETLAQMLYVDLHTSLVDEMLPKVDRMSMAWGLEARVPLLDHRVVEASVRIPGALKRQGEMGKLPLRRLVRKRLGRDAADRPKSGFNSPLPDWLRTDASTRGTFEDLWTSVARCGVFDGNGTDALRRSFDGGNDALANPLFALLVYGMWSDQRPRLAA